MVPSALRTLSVVTLLSAVSGTVFLVNDHGHHSGRAGQALISSSSGPGFASAALLHGRDRAPASAVTYPASAAQTEEVVHRVELRESARWRVQAHHQVLVRAVEARAVQAKLKAAAHRAAELKASARRSVTAATEVSRSASRDPKSVARLLVADHGWSSSQFSCLVSLWNRESGWRVHASNPSSGAYGIPQALPGGKMASAGPNWRNDDATQIRWGLGYIADRYGTPCGAWSHSEATGWY